MPLMEIEVAGVDVADDLMLVTLALSSFFGFLDLADGTPLRCVLLVANMLAWTVFQRVNRWRCPYRDDRPRSATVSNHSHPVGSYPLFLFML
mmetsp:Transcript_10570/g.24673  ORF Transcript_10570/g.24673 Transcript_10570/m.24673 type:complete len:92 (+) Transcript_10570:4120-4395(+)